MNEEIIDAKVEGGNVPMLANDNIILMAREAEKRIEAIKKIKSIALRVTNMMDWRDQGGKPYLQVSGSQKVGRVFGISWSIDVPQKETYDDGHYLYTYKGEFSWGGATIEAIGTRSSRDEFFTTRYKDDQKTILTPDMVDEGDVKKAAFTNCIGNGVTSLLGIRNLTWEDLKEFGIERDKVGKVEYKKEMSEEATDKIAEMGKMVTDLATAEGIDAATYLEKATEWTDKDGKKVPGKKSVSQLTEKQIKFQYPKIKKAYEEKFGKDAKPEPSEAKKEEPTNGNPASKEQKDLLRRMLKKKGLGDEEFKQGFDTPLDNLLASQMNEALKWVEGVKA